MENTATRLILSREGSPVAGQVRCLYKTVSICLLETGNVKAALHCLGMGMDAECRKRLREIDGHVVS